MADALEKSQTLLMRNLSPTITKEQLRDILNEIDDVEGNLVDISFNLTDDLAIALLTFDSIKTATVVRDTLHESHLGPNFTPTEVTYTYPRPDMTDFNTKPSCIEQPGLSAVEKRKCESACKQNGEIKNNSGKASSGHRRPIAPSGLGTLTSNTRSSPRQKRDSFISKVTAASEKSLKHEPVPASDCKTKVTLLGKSKKRMRASLATGSSDNKQTNTFKANKGAQGGNKASADRRNERPKNPNQSKPYSIQKENPNDVIAEDIPRFVNKADLAALISKSSCKGFTNVIISSEVTSNKRSAVFTFESRAYAVEAFITLYGKRVKGFCMDFKLAKGQDGVGNLIAKKKVQALLNDITVQGNKVSSELKSRMNDLTLQVKEIKEKLEDCSSIQEAISLEQQKIALQQQVVEAQSYQGEFDQVSSAVTDKLQQLQPFIFKSVNLANLDDLRQRFLRECRRIHQPLPIYGYKTSILETITASDTNACVIRAETGSGQSTQVPQYLIEDDDFLFSTNKDGAKNKIICTQPRRIAAISLARRVAEEYGCTVGEEVGCVAGNTQNVSSKTLVTFMTDRALLNITLTDKNDMNDCACVIIDEAHERSVDTDILLAMLKKIQERRSNFKIVIMSATIDVDLFSKYLFNCPVINIPGRTFPVDTKWAVDTTNSEDYVFKAVQKVTEIQQNEKLPGDILVFLTSQNEIERACNQIASALKIKDWQDSKNEENVIILPLHGKLQPDYQMKVFKETPHGKRKIVFATNVAETSVTIPGIKYVVDTGMVKECQYVPERNMSLLKVTNILQASAEQRKGRAGRTGPGICYRLYSKTDYEEMEQTKKPEILRVHLGMAMLQLIQMGVKDVQNFDFVESPEKGAIEQAMISLLHLGAVNDCRQLTSVGQKMAKLPLEPRLAKLVLTGIEKNLVIEAVSIAALVSAPGNIVYRGSTEADRQTSDMMKLEYSSEGGDVLSMLKIYKKWLGVDEKHRSTWCKKNSMNAKTLRSVKEHVDEITKVLQKALNIGNDKSNVSEDEINTEMDTLLRKILTSVYFENLSIYNGHARAGYTIVAQQKTAVVHPSSVFKSFDSQPQWVIYGDLKRTTQDFICNLTPVDSGWIDEAEVVPASFRDTFDREAFERNVTHELKIENVGTALMKNLAWKRFEKLRRLEDNITQETDTPCIIEADGQGDSLNVFVASHGGAHAKQKIYDYLEDEKTRARQEQKEVSVGSLHSNVRHVVVAGGETGFVLMGTEYRSLDVSNVPSHVEKDEIIKLCGCQYNQVKDIFKFPSHWSQAKRGQWGKVTFLKPSDAEHAKNILEKTVYEGEVVQISAEPSMSKPNAIGPRKRPAIEIAVEVTWFMGRSKGIAFVACDTNADSLTLIDNVTGLALRGKSIRCELKKEDTRVVFISGLDYHVTQDELENGIKKATRIAFNSVSIPRHKPTVNIKNATVKKQLRRLFENEGIVWLDINILDPLSEKSRRRKGLVNFNPSFQQQMNDKVKELQANSVLIANTQEIYHFRMLITSSIYCTEHIYELLTDQIEELIDKAEGADNEIVIKSTQSKNRSGRCIHISGNDYQKVLEIRSTINSLLHGEELTVEEFVGEEKSEQWVQRSLNNLSQRCLQDFLGKTSTAFTVIDTRRRVIHVYGNDGDREELKNVLHNYFLSFTKTRVKEVRGVKGQVLRALVLKFGPWLEKLKEEPGVEDISIDTKRGVLMITGSEEVQRVVIDQIEECIKSTSVASEGTTERIDCGICWCPPDSDEKTYRLLSCGHYFCLNCLKQLLTHAIDDKTFPIVCPREDCTESLLLVDIRTIFPEEEKQTKLFRSALEAFVTQKSKQCELKFCPSPDCCMIYRQSTDGGIWTCTECGHQICSACGQDPHPGNMSCAEYRISQQRSDSVLKWASASGSDVKQCPTPSCCFIEKFKGCNRVSCTQCKKHICWNCLEAFDTSTECYNHLTEKHGGCFDY